MEASVVITRLMKYNVELSISLIIQSHYYLQSNNDINSFPCIVKTYIIINVYFHAQSAYIPLHVQEFANDIN